MKNDEKRWVDEYYRKWKMAEARADKAEARITTLQTQAENAENDAYWLAKACRRLIDYRDRNTLNFQLEKADDFMRNIRAALAAHDELEGKP